MTDPTTRAHGLGSTAAARSDSWWPWSPSSSGDVSCPESAVLFDALRRRVTASGRLRGCCVDKIGRVLDFVVAITPGHTSLDLTGVTLLEAPVAAAIVSWQSRLADRGLRLAIVGASPAVARTLDR